MQRIDDRTVELAPFEQVLRIKFDELLSEGFGIQDAAFKVVTTRRLYIRNRLTAEFVEYLSDGTLTWLPTSRIPQVVKS